MSLGSMELVVFMLHVKRSERGLASLFSSFWSTATLRLKESKASVSRESYFPQTAVSKANSRATHTTRAVSRGPGSGQHPISLTAVQTHSKDKASAYGAETKVRLDGRNNWRSLELGAWGKLPHWGKTTHQLWFGFKSSVAPSPTLGPLATQFWAG